jgi:hypothetical protein
MNYNITNQANPTKPLILIFNSVLTYIILDIAFNYYSWSQIIKIVIFTIYTILNILRLFAFIHLSLTTKHVEITEDLKFKIKK